MDENDLSALGDAKNLADALTDAVSKGNDAVEKFARTLVDKIGNIATQSVSNFNDGLETIHTQLKENIDDVNKFSDSSIVLNENIDNIVNSIGTLGQFISNSKFFDKFSNDAVSSLNLIGTNADKLLSVMQKFKLPGFDQLEKISGPILQNANQAEKLEGTYINLASSAGDLNSLFDEQTGKLKNLQAITTSYVDIGLRNAQITGMSAEESIKFSNALKAIPGVFEENIRSGNANNESMNSGVAIMRLMSGTGQSQTTVLNSLKESYNNLSQAQGRINDSGSKGAEFFATVSNAANTLTIDFSEVKTVMDAISSEFRNVGNETDGAARVLTQYTEALRQTGLTSKASLDITQSMITGIDKLTTGTKAFLSLRSGGAGGLQGAFQIDELLRNGKIDQVVNMAQRNLRQQFGGRIYTQAEAAQSPEAASQFMRQRELLKSGAFGIGGGTNDAQATRLLEALGKGNMSGITNELKTGQDALRDATDKGSQIQERNNNELKRIALSIDQISIYEEIQAGATVRNAIGTGNAESKTTEDLQNSMRPDSNNMLANERFLNYKHGNASVDDAAKELSLLGRSATKNLTNPINSTIGNVDSAVGNLFGTNDSLVSAANGQTPQQRVYNSGITNNDARRNINSVVNNTTHNNTNNHMNTPAAQKQQKILLEIVAPAGMNFKTSSDSDAIITINNGNANPTGKF